MRHIFHTRRRTAIQRRGRGLASPRIAHHTPRTAHDTPHTTHQRRDCPSRTLPNNVARNSPRSFFDYASKRCNSNTANSKFEIVSRELRATLIEGPAVEGHEDYSSDRPDQHHTPQIDQTSTTHRTPDSAHHAPARGLPEPQRNNRTLPNNVARNSPRSFFDYASKRCNSNAANSKFEIVTRELRATLIEQARRRPTARHGTRRQAGPQAPRQGPRVRRHREPGRLVTTVNAAMASSIEESGPALR